MTTSEWIRIALSWLGTYAVHSTLFLGCAWVLCAFRPPRTNRNRERLWKLGLIGGLLSATLQLAVGARPWLGHIDWQPWTYGETHEAVDHEAQADRAAALHEREPTNRKVEATEAEAEPAAAVVKRRSGTPTPRRNESTPANAPSDSVPVASTHARDSGSTFIRSPRVTTADPSVDPGLASSLAEPPPRLGDSASRGARWMRDLQRVLSSARRSWPGLVFLGWTVVGLASLLGIVGSWTCLRRRMLGRTQLRTGALVERLAELRRRAGVAGTVRLSVSPRIAAPFSTGLLRPEICVPTAVLTDLSATQQEVLLAHELAHLVRRDPAWFGVSFVIEKLFFFQPLNRLARRELGELAELACDDWAVRWTGARLALASCLTEVAEWVLGEPPRALSLPGLAGRRSRLGRRVARLLDDRRSPSNEPRAPWWPALASGALSIVVLAAPGISASASRALPREILRAPPTEPALGAPVSDPLPPPALGREAQDAAAPTTVSTERSVLEAELTLLQAEIDELHSEFEQRALGQRFAEALERIDARMAALRTQQARVRELLEKLTALQDTPQNAPAPEVEPGR